jgi:hypothetical protein
MWEEILKISINYGLMSALFTGLLVWVLKDSRTREHKYQSMVDKLHDALAVVHDIQRNTEEIRDTIKRRFTNDGTAEKNMGEDTVKN